MKEYSLSELRECEKTFDEFYRQTDRCEKNDWPLYMDTYARYKKPFLIDRESHEALANMIGSAKPFSAIRMGNTEANIVVEYIEKSLGGRKHYSQRWIDWLTSTSGFFIQSADTLQEEVDRFAKMQLRACEDCEVLLVWHPIYMDFIANECTNKDVCTVRFNSILPFKKNFAPWTRALAGKRVLVVTSFPESVKRQYARKSQISRWQISELPDFELLTYPMINTMMGNKMGFDSWFDAYEFIKIGVLSLDFDIAIVGAGEYGAPLCVDIKRAGKQAIELCSYTPLIFGVMGRRHQEHGVQEKFGTKAWIHPIEEKPAYYKEIENGCYW